MKQTKLREPWLCSILWIVSIIIGVWGIETQANVLPGYGMVVMFIVFTCVTYMIIGWLPTFCSRIDYLSQKDMVAYIQSEIDYKQKDIKDMYLDIVNIENEIRELIEEREKRPSI